MTEDLPDHTNYSLIKAVDENGNLVTVLVDSSGSIVSVMKGDYDGTLKTLKVDSNGRMVTVIRDPTNDRYLAVDADGNIVAVMKGDYDGTLKSISVDAQGRIQAILTDPEDVFGNATFIGAGELAARLNSINSFEKRGNVIFMDNFSSPTIKYLTSGTGTGWSVNRTNENAKSDLYSVKLVTGDAENNTTYAYHYTYYPALTQFGFEMSFALGTNIKGFWLWLYMMDGALAYQPYVEYRPQDLILRLWDETLTPQTIASGLDLYENDKLFHTLKYVIDLTNHKYVRAYLDGVQYDISAYSYWEDPYVVPPRIEARAGIVNNSSGNHYTYIDNLILTQNEP